MRTAYKARRRRALIILLVGLPVYVMVALLVLSLFDRPSPVVEIFVYVGLGIGWILPLRGVFRGVGREDPQQQQDADRKKAE